MSNKTTFQLIAEELAEALRPLRNAVANVDTFCAFLRDLGWNASSIPTVYSSLANDVNQIVSTLQNLGGSPSISDITNLISKAEALYKNIEAIQNTGGNKPTGVDLNVFLQDAAKKIFGFLINNYARLNVPKIYQTLVLGGVITRVHHPETTTVSGTPELRPAYDEVKFDTDRLTALLSSPSTIPSVVYGWGSSTFDYQTLLGNFLELFASMGFASSLKTLPNDFTSNYGLKGTDQSAEEWGLYLPLFNIIIVNQSQAIGLIMSGFHGDERTPSKGIIIQPFIPTGTGSTIDLGTDFELNLRSTNNLLQKFAIIITGDALDVRFPGQPNTTLPEAGFGATLSYTPDSSLTILGNPTSSRLEMKGADLSLHVDHLGSSFEIEFNANLKDLAIVIAGGDGDGFISKLLGNTEKRIELELGISWSNTGGLRFVGAGGFELELKPHIVLGPLTIENLRLALQAPPGSPAKAKAIAAAGLKLALGPFTAVVQEIGVELALTFAEGNAGPFDIRAGFKPPTGLGLKIENPTISGGGFLSFNREEGRYVGALELCIKDKIAVKAIGILTTELPGGQQGYSLLLLITAEFQPIQLGFGFTLNGVGGLIALHRRMNTDALRAGVRDNTIDNILFPADPVNNIDGIITSLEKVFPIQEGRFSFGPMAIIGWGTPTLITAELGLFFELPDVNEIALIGVVRAILPKEDKPILKLQIAFAGIVNFEKKTIMFDATLFDSSVAGMSVSGDMIFRLRYGDQPAFVLSVGGFHPNFPIPPLNIPSMRRLTINLLSGDNPRLTFTSYFAITSNTTQFGAAIDFYWSINDKVKVLGHLGYDAIFYFSPFRFQASMQGSLEVQRNGKTLFGIWLAALLEGPTPWHVRGSVSFKVLGIQIDKSFDKTFGNHDYTTLPDVEVLPKLLAALQDKKNWQTKMAGGSDNLLVTVKELSVTPTELVMHPQGTISVRQKVVPLGLHITRFGNCRPSDYFKFSLRIELPGDPNPAKTDLKEYFSPNEFFNLSESDKLGRASFESQTAGLEITSSASTDLTSDVSRYRRRIYTYDDIVMDSRRHPFRLAVPSVIDDIAARAFSGGREAENSPLNSTAHMRSENAPPMVSVRNNTYSIASISNMNQHGTSEFGSYSEAIAFLENEVQTDPSLEGRLQIVNTYELN